VGEDEREDVARSATSGRELGTTSLTPPRPSAQKRAPALQARMAAMAAGAALARKCGTWVFAVPLRPSGSRLCDTVTSR